MDEEAYLRDDSSFSEGRCKRLTRSPVRFILRQPDAGALSIC
jgi:hypothetical protein